MSFYGSSFIFNSIPSENYDVRILSFESSGGLQSSPAGNESTLFTKNIYRKPKTYYFGRSQNAPLEVNLTIGKLGYTSAIERSALEQWLLGKNSFLPLQIVQEDLSNVYFNLIFTKAENFYVGNVNVGMILHGTCDSGFAWEYPKSLVKNYGSGVITVETFDFYNYSDDNDYLYPSLSFTTNAIGDSFGISNNTDLSGTQFLSSPFGGGGTVVAGPRIFSFTGISANETITVDCYRESILSSTGLMRMSKFNKKFFRLLPGNNNLTITGGISNFTLTTSFAKKVGA